MIEGRRKHKPPLKRPHLFDPGQRVEGRVRYPAAGGLIEHPRSVRGKGA